VKITIVTLKANSNNSWIFNHQVWLYEIRCTTFTNGVRNFISFLLYKQTRLAFKCCRKTVKLLIERFVAHLLHYKGFLQLRINILWFDMFFFILITMRKIRTQNLFVYLPKRSLLHSFGWANTLYLYFIAFFLSGFDNQIHTLFSKSNLLDNRWSYRPVSFFNIAYLFVVYVEMTKKKFVSRSEIFIIPPNVELTKTYSLDCS
jgi:hypothetical protein